MQNALVLHGIVQQFVTPLDGFTLDDYPAAVRDNIVQAPDNVQVNWTYDGKIFAAPVIPPAGPVVRSVQGAILVHTLDKATKVTARDLAYVAGLASAREDMASIARIAAVDGSTPKAWFDAAFGVTA